MITGIHSSFYWAQNMDETVAFYRDALGLDLLARIGDDWAQFEVGGATVALHGTRGAAPATAGATIVFEVDDLEEAVLLLRSRGVPFEGEITQVPDSGRFASFRDPAGNLLQIYQPAAAGRGSEGPG